MGDEKIFISDTINSG